MISETAVVVMAGAAAVIFEAAAVVVSEASPAILEAAAVVVAEAPPVIFEAALVVVVAMDAAAPPIWAGAAVTGPLVVVAASATF